MALFDELNQQPEALRRLVEFYQHNLDLLDLGKRFPARRIVLTGMGASFHAAWISSYHMNQLGILNTVVEATDLLNYGMSTLDAGTLLIYVSQSGSSGEVPAVLERLNPGVSLVVVTNYLDSTLASAAKLNLPIVAGEENLIASKTYLNTLAILWLLTRRMAGVSDGSEFAALTGIADCISAQLHNAESISRKLLSTFDGCQPLIFLGYGPHSVTARQAAMMLSEWAKMPVLNYSTGAFRHGYIEIVEQGCGVVLISPPGQGAMQANSLGRDLQKYGARLLLVENGLLRHLSEPAAHTDPLDEFLSPLVDSVPFQIYTEALALVRGFGSGFRYISKIVTQL